MACPRGERVEAEAGGEVGAREVERGGEVFGDVADA